MGSSMGVPKGNRTSWVEVTLGNFGLVMGMGKFVYFEVLYRRVEPEGIALCGPSDHRCELKGYQRRRWG